MAQEFCTENDLCTRGKKKAKKKKQPKTKQKQTTQKSKEKTKPKKGTEAATGLGDMDRKLKILEQAREQGLSTEQTREKVNGESELV